MARSIPIAHRKMSEPGELSACHTPTLALFRNPQNHAEEIQNVLHEREQNQHAANVKTISSDVISGIFWQATKIP
jgi:hypothetical protein